MENTLDARTAAEILGDTVKTLPRWEREGKLIPVDRTRTNRRRDTEAQLLAHMGRRPALVATRTMMTSLHCFSSRLDGLRNYRRKLNDALEQDHAAGAPHPA